MIVKMYEQNTLIIVESFKIPNIWILSFGWNIVHCKQIDVIVGFHFKFDILFLPHFQFFLCKTSIVIKVYKRT
jgi:hypothetical protein